MAARGNSLLNLGFFCSSGRRMLCNLIRACSAPSVRFPPWGCKARGRRKLRSVRVVRGRPSRGTRNASRHLRHTAVCCESTCRPYVSLPSRMTAVLRFGVQRMSRRVLTHLVGHTIDLDIVNSVFVIVFRAQCRRPVHLQTAIADVDRWQHALLSSKLRLCNVRLR